MTSVSFVRGVRDSFVGFQPREPALDHWQSHSLLYSCAFTTTRPAQVLSDCKVCGLRFVTTWLRMVYIDDSTYYYRTERYRDVRLYSGAEGSAIAADTPDRDQGILYYMSSRDFYRH